MNIEKGADKVVKTMRVLVTDRPVYLGRLTTAIGSSREISATSGTDRFILPLLLKM